MTPPEHPTTTSTSEQTVDAWVGKPAARKRPYVLWTIAGLTTMLTLLPLVYLLIRPASLGTRAWAIGCDWGTLIILLRTTGLAVAVTTTAVMLGVSLAWLTTRTNLRHRSLWAIGTALPLVIPSYVGAFAFVAALGPRGILQDWLAPFGLEKLPSIYGFPGSWLVLTLFTFPYVTLSVRASFRGLDPRIEDAARSLGKSPWQVFREITLPQLTPSIHAGAILVALYTLSDFGAVSMLQFNSFTREIYIQYTSSLDRSAAAVYALFLIALTLVVLSIEFRSRGKAKYYLSGSGTPPRHRTIQLGRWQFAAQAYCGLITMLSVVIPLVIIFSWLVRGIRAGETLMKSSDVIVNSMLASSLAATACVAMALPVAVLSVRYPGRASRLVERCAHIGYALPGIVVALALVFIGARYIPSMYQTLPLLILAYVVLFLPQSLGSLRTSLLRLSPRLEDAAHSLAKNSRQVLTTVMIPLMRPGILTGLALVFLTCMKELPATHLLGPTGFQTLATSIWSATEEAFYGRAATPALLLILLSAISLGLLLSQEDKGLRS